MLNNNITSGNIIPSLNGWRALAILLVFLSHAGLGSIVPGGLGVTIFFFLSGYLITTLICREYERSKTISVKNFYARRALRLLPPLAITLILTYSLTYLGFLAGGVSLFGFFSQLFYFANYYGLFIDPGNTTPLGTGIFWSLSVEEHFYFIFPLIFLWLYSLNSRLKLTISLVAIAILVLMWRIYLVAVLHVHESRVFYATDTRIDSIIFGCLLALINNPMKHINYDSALRRIDYVILGIGVFGILFSILYRGPIFRETIRYSLQGVALCPIFFYSIKNHRNFLFRTLQLEIVQRLGIYSYSIYLIHYILLERFQHVTQWLILDRVLAMVGAIFFAIAIDHFVDKPAREIKLRFN